MLRLAPIGVVALVGVVALLPLAEPQVAHAATCDSSSVALTPLQSPDGTMRPMYVDIKNGNTLGSGYVGYELAGATGVLGNDVWVKLSNFAGGKVGLASGQSASIPVRATAQDGKPLVYAYLTASALSTTAQTWDVEVWNGKPGQTGSTQICTATDGFSEVDSVISASANKITSISVSTTQPAIGGTFSVTAVGDTGTMGAGVSTDQSGANGVFSMAPAMADNWPADTFALTGVHVTIGGSTSYDKLRIYPGTSAAGAYTAVYTFTVRGSASGGTVIQPVQNIASGTQVKYTGSYPATTTIPAPVQTTTLVKSASNFASGDLTYKVVVSNSSNGPVTLDYVQDSPTPTSGWTFDTGTAKLNGSVISDPANSSGTLIFGGPFTVPAANGGTSGTLTFLYTLHLSATVQNDVSASVGGQILGAPSGTTQNVVTIDPNAPIITSGVLAAATKGSAYSQTLTGTSGTTPYTWTVSAGSLPPGLVLSSAGVLSGTPTTDGTYAFTITLTDAGAKTATQSESVTVSDPVVLDTAAPSGSLTIDGGASVTNSAALTLSLSATDDTGVTGYRVAEGSDCSGASWAAVSAAASFSGSASVAVSGGDGTKTVCVQYEDAAGNVSSTSTATISLDATSPTVALSSTAASLVNAAFSVTATFSESVTGLTAGDVAVGDGTVSGLSGSGTTYTFTVTPTSAGTVTVDLPAGSASDPAGNGNTAAAQLTRSYDGTRPSVALSSAAPDPTSHAFTVTATFSKSVTGLALGDFAVGNGSKSSLSGSGSTYTLTITPAADGTVTVDLPAGSATDAYGNTSTAAAQLTRTYDATRPTVTLSTTAPDPTNANFTVKATFSESVTGLSLGDFSVGNGTAADLSGSGSTYTVMVTPAGTGVVTVDLPAGAATDAAGNTSTAAARLSRNFDSDRPTVTLTTSAPNPTNLTFTVTATFSKSVAGFTLGDVDVGDGAASGLSGSGSTYTFTVSPAAAGTVTVAVVAGAGTDNAGNTSLASAQLVRSYDADRPGVVLTTTAPSPTSAASFPVTALFSKSITGLTLSDVAVGNGTASNLAGSGATYTFTVKPDADGDVTIDLPAGSVTDAVGNTNTAATRLVVTSDRTPPGVLITTGPPATTAATSATFDFLADDTTATSTCSLDGAAFAACSSPLTLTGLAAGKHSLEVHVVDQTGNDSTLGYDWAVGTPPAFALATTSGPGAATTATSASIAFSANGADGASTYSCRLDGSSFSACHSPYTAANLGVGTHTVEVKATDGSGATTTSSYSWTVVAAGAPDVRIAMQASQREVIAGKEFNTTVTATNMGGRTAQDVVLHIALPSNTEFISGTASRSGTEAGLILRYGRDIRTTASASFPCSVGGGMVSCPVGDLKPADQFVVQLTLRALHTGSIEVGADVRSSNAKAKQAQVWLNARPAKLDIAVELKTSRSYDRVRPGEVFTARGTVTNVGGSTAEDVRVRLILPPIARFVAGTTERISAKGAAVAGKAWECERRGAKIACPIGAMQPHDRFVIHLRLRAGYGGQVRIVAVGSSANQKSVRSHLIITAAGSVSAGGKTVTRHAVVVRTRTALLAVVRFDSGSSALSAQAKAILAGVASRDVSRLALACHTDDVGSLAYNLALSKARCLSVSAYLAGLDRGVRITGKAYAFLRPEASNTTAAGKAKNRRVEIRGTTRR